MSEESEQRDYEALNAKTALDLNKAQQEIERLTFRLDSEVKNTDLARRANELISADNERLTIQVMHAENEGYDAAIAKNGQENERLTSEREALRIRYVSSCDERDTLRADNERLRAVYEAADKYFFATMAVYDCRPRSRTELRAALDNYERGRKKALAAVEDKT